MIKLVKRLIEIDNGRLFWLLVSQFIVSLVAVGIVAFMFWWMLWDNYSPLGNYPTQIVANRVAGITMPAAYLDDRVHVIAVKCNDSKETQHVEGHTFLVRTDVFHSVEIYSGVGVRKSGCETMHFYNLIPSMTVSGTYKIRGFDIARKGDKSQYKFWETEEFRLVERQ